MATFITVAPHGVLCSAFSTHSTKNELNDTPLGGMTSTGKVFGRFSVKSLGFGIVMYITESGAVLHQTCAPEETPVFVRHLAMGK